jgi:hypothetical protein
MSVLSLVFLNGCGARSRNVVEDHSGTDDMSKFVLRSLSGTRDGERLRVQALYGDDSRRLMVHLQFRLTPRARLESGTWTGPSGEGSVRERSVTFLGGQSGPPSIGGSFDLTRPDGQTAYRVNIPVQPLKDPL